ncbi:hypothetical protein [Actinoallomurus vinaceus]|uniref:hypothetical protein n=1 Tax=Actinoallomurus vinaceus TaxID=1080074 RepID=UPI0031EA1673
MSVEQAAVEAGQDLDQAAGVSYSGTYGAKPAIFGVTRAGSAYGSFATGGSPVRQVEVAGTVYLKTDAAFWAAHGLPADSAGRVGGRWAKAMDGVIGMRVAYLSAPYLAKTLEQVGNDPHARTVSVGGRPAIELTSGSITYDIARNKPRRLLRIKGTAGDDRFSLGVTPLQPGDTRSVFARLRGDVQELQGAFDPGITPLQDGKIQFSACGQSGCMVRGTVTPTADKDPFSSTKRSDITMNVSFGAGGPATPTCVGTGSAEKYQKVTITCRATSTAWSSWYRAQSHGNELHATATFDAHVNSTADIQHLLAGIDHERLNG